MKVLSVLPIFLLIILCSTSANDKVLHYFEGHFEGNDVILEWTFESDIEVQSVEVERCTGLKNSFSFLGTIPISENYESALFLFVDEQPILGTGLYRLKVLTKKGVYHSSVVEMKSTKHPRADVIMNPFTEEGEIVMDAKKSSIANLTAISMETGAIAYEEDWKLESGTNRRSYKNWEMQSGLYQVSISTANGISTVVIEVE